MKQFAILVDVLGTDCTNGGITSNRSRVLLIVEDGNIDVETERGDLPVLKIVSGSGHRSVKAINADSGRSGMFGGNFIYSSDSRFPSDQPIHVHDRFEG